MTWYKPWTWFKCTGESRKIVECDECGRFLGVVENCEEETMFICSKCNIRWIILPKSQKILDEYIEQ